MAKNKGIYRLFRTKAELDAYDEDVRHIARVYQMDDVYITLGRMGWRQEEYAKFIETLKLVQYENAIELMSDFKTDRDMWYGKARKDRELKEYMGSLFLPWEVRYR